MEILEVKQINSKILDEETCNKLREAYYKKLGLETLIKESQDTVTDELYTKYGEAVDNFTIEGNKIVVTNFGNGNIDFINKVKNWSCDFNTREFKIVRK